MGRKKKGRSVHGVLLLDKPLHISSNHALQKVKRLFDAQKAGHTGSLDPLATGMLPICLGEATKVSAFLLDADKTYRFKCQLGTRTATADAEGEVIEIRPFEQVALKDIEKVIPRFIGDIEQIPPMYSALKKDGQRLYELARQGIEVERKPRPVTIYKLDIISFVQGEIELEVQCSKGTYVRTLAEDIGEALGCGAFVTELRRLSVGPYTGNMISLEQLEQLAEQGFDALDAELLPLDSGIVDWPEVRLDADSAFYVKQGQPVQIAKSPTQGWVRIYAGEDFIGLGEIQDDGRIAPRRMMNL
ncbi:MAG: tRNA pseudouridine(55) synthase TruB [Gammaproteobacteria bacterium]|nr:tRNA pseudouridine(55) synthase TruB [Gammaproteobacteria bacterium]MCW8909116.1 tRNA pseudouridine(55) synthase TruB [Gammaproteobacteria bacterium]MCW9005910.1 tRNA pseudouridine(55) synthase TruB [Gammaproteobacteria bacterium]MCW9056568.1 tRNA pseudouridine(55) synthase TruB [Gammaproteobacteria bacterium]